MYALLPLSPRKARHFPPSSGEADIKEERNYIFHYLNTLFRLSDAGFLPLPLVGYGVSLHFSVAPLLKIQFACHRSFSYTALNSYHHSDSVRRSRMTAELFLFCHDVLMLNEYIKERIENASCPRLSGKVSAELTKGARVSRHGRNFYLYTQACPYRLA